MLYSCCIQITLHNSGTLKAFNRMFVKAVKEKAIDRRKFLLESLYSTENKFVSHQLVTFTI